MQVAWIGFPVDATGIVQTVPGSIAVTPFTFSSGLKYDAQGRLVISQ